MNNLTKKLKGKISNFLSNVWVYTLIAAMFALFFYPMWTEDRMYMVEWSITLITGVTAFVLAKGYEMNFTPKLLPVVALLWLYAVGQAARAKTIAQLPCTTWEKTTCTACTEEEVSRSGVQCVAAETYECDVCSERTWQLSPSEPVQTW